jgi:hypothetical protein
MFEAVLFAALTASPAPPATKSCANPRLPTAILAGPAALTAGEPLPVVTVAAGTVTLRLAVAAAAEARETGLMCVTGLAPHGGMLFAFTEDAQHDFWMKNTLVPLDMLWVAADGTIRSVAANVPASTLSTPEENVARRGGRGKYVIELPPGEAAGDGLAVGVKLDLPTVAAE